MFFNILILVLIKIMDLMKSIMKGKEERKKLYKFKVFKYEELEPDEDMTKWPFPRSGHRVVADTCHLYSFGGYNPKIQGNQSVEEFSVSTFPLFQELWKFNIAKKEWVPFEKSRSFPKELASNAIIRHGDYLLVYGGTGTPFGQRCSNQLYIISLKDIKSKMCEILTTGQVPLPQYGQALVCNDNYLYTIGGTNGFTYTCDVHRLDMKTNVWENVYICQGRNDSEPLGRYRHEVAFNGRYIFILGGGTAEMAFDFKRVPAFDIKQKTWDIVKSKPDPKFLDVGGGIPAPRRCHGLVQLKIDGSLNVFISGGYDGEDVFYDLWRLNLDTFQWSLIPTCVLPYPTYFHSSAVTPEGKLYNFGGIYINGDLKRHNLVHSTWLCIPKLSEMCWEALLFYKPDIADCDRLTLLNQGYPRSFLKRLD